MAKKEVQKIEEVKEAKLIIAPRITEKASMQSAVNAYTFVVTQNATKLALAKEIEKTFKVKPVAINITKIPAQKTFVRGRFGSSAPIKKAIVFLKKGDTINLA